MPLTDGGRDDAAGGGGAVGARFRLDSIASEVYADLRLEPVLRRIIDHTGTVAGTASGAISIVDGDAGRYTKAAERGVACQVGMSFPLDEGATGRAVALRRPVVLRDYADLGGGHLSAQTPAGHRSVLAVPAWWRGEVIGVNVVFRPPGVGFPTAVVDAVEALTQVLAPAMRLVRPARQREDPAAGAAVVLDSPRADPLTEREHEVLELLRHGLTDRAIGTALGRSARTVEKHVGALMRKTGAANRTAAVMTALERGWLAS